MKPNLNRITITSVAVAGSGDSGGHAVVDHHHIQHHHHLLGIFVGPRQGPPVRVKDHRSEKQPPPHSTATAAHGGAAPSPALSLSRFSLLSRALSLLPSLSLSSFLSLLVPLPPFTTTEQWWWWWLVLLLEMGGGVYRRKSGRRRSLMAPVFANLEKEREWGCLFGVCLLKVREREVEGEGI
ncbi:hypothetical protein HanIR_Chr17g0868641 [Helianthus annuus]|nr:hypothetical protein HanIR_Chr17g0868641 [Helianthus annuus]